MPKDPVSELAEKKGTVKKMQARSISVRQLASNIGAPSVERLLAQFKDAQINIKGADDMVSEEDQQNCSPICASIMVPNLNLLRKNCTAPR